MSGEYYVPVPGNGTMAVNSQLLIAPMDTAYYPGIASAPFYKGSGQGPPTVPINYLNASSMQSNDYMAASAANDPWNFFKSPVIISIVALFGGIIWLRYIHWRH